MLILALRAFSFTGDKMATKAENSLNDQVNEIREAFFRQSFIPPMGGMDSYYVEDIFPDYIIAEMEDKYFKIGYTKEAGKVVFASRDTWAEMEESWKPATAKSADMLVSIGDAVKVISEDEQGIRITGVLAQSRGFQISQLIPTLINLLGGKSGMCFSCCDYTPTGKVKERQE